MISFCRGFYYFVTADMTISCSFCDFTAFTQNSCGNSYVIYFRINFAVSNKPTYCKIYLIKWEAIICGIIRGVGRGGRGGGGGHGHWPPIKSGQGAKKGHIFLATFALSAINQSFLVTLFPHIVNLPAHSITTNCSENKINFGNFQ